MLQTEPPPPHIFKQKKRGDITIVNSISLDHLYHLPRANYNRSGQMIQLLPFDEINTSIDRYHKAIIVKF